MNTRPRRRRLSWRLRLRRWLLIAQAATIFLLGMDGTGLALLGYPAAATVFLLAAAGSATAGCLSADQWARDAAQEAAHDRR